jgi:hypothetical protein
MFYIYHEPFLGKRKPPDHRVAIMAGAGLLQDDKNAGRFRAVEREEVPMAPKKDGSAPAASWRKYDITYAKG